MKKIFIFFTLFIFGCTSEVPHHMEEELAFRSDRWMKGSDWSWFWYSFQYKVYNGPAYTTHKNGERKEKGDIDNGAKSGLGSGWDEKGNLIYKGNYLSYVIITIILSVIIYYLNDFSRALGETEQISLDMSVWTPLTIVLMFSSIGLIHVNEK